MSHLRKNIILDNCVRMIWSCALLVFSTVTNTVKAQNTNPASSIDSLANLAQMAFDNKDPGAALLYYDKAKQIINGFYGIDSSQSKSLLYNIARCYFALGYQSQKKGCYMIACDYYEKSLTILDRISGGTEIEGVYIRVLEELDYCCCLVGQYERAIGYKKRLLGLYSKKNEGQSHHDYVMCIHNIGLCYIRIGSYDIAYDYLQRALSLSNEVWGSKNLEYATIINSLGDCCMRKGRYVEALDYCQMALNIRQHLLGEDSPDYAYCLNDIGICYEAMGNYSKALDCSQRSLLILEEAHRSNTLSYAQSLMSIGICYYDMGALWSAMSYYEKSLEITRMAIGEYNIDYSEILNNMGNCYNLLGDNKKALECYLNSLRISGEVIGRNSLAYATSLFNIGDCYYSINDYNEAYLYYLKAAEIRSVILGDNHYDYVSCLVALGNCSMRNEAYDRALAYYKEAENISKIESGILYSRYASILCYEGDCYASMANGIRALWSARGCYSLALMIFDATVGNQSQQYNKCLFRNMTINGALKDKEELSRTLDKCLRYNSKMIVNQLVEKSYSQRERLWSQFEWFYNDKVYEYSLFIMTEDVNALAYNCALFGKGLLLNTEIEMRKLIMESGDEESVHMFNETQTERVRLGKLYENPYGRKAEIDSLNADLEKRQIELARRSKAFGDYTRNLTVKWEDVRDALKKDDIAIEFASYASADTTYYLALTLKKDYDAPHLVKLFTDKDISNTNANWYSLPSSTETVWGNLRGELDGVQNVYFSPVGEINNIAIEYLPDADGKHLISDKRNYYRLSSTRELVKDRKQERVTDAVVFGGISYNITPKSKLNGNESASQLLAMSADRQHMSLDSLRLERSGWKYLPGTKKEAESIIDALGRMRVSTNLFEGEDGTEESFKALDGAKNQLIHIATHGFYYTERDAGRLDDMRFMLTDESMAPKEDKMLTRSGLLFAGAANTLEGKEVPKDVEDGIVTARDISRMDLRGTDLVVLSACQSGLGDITGDGVFGLQRGFKKAGVKTIVMSLWKVNDEATRIMMTRFYDNMLKGKDKHTAFIEAQNYLRKYNKGKYDDPYYYSAFIILDALEN